MPDKRHQNCKFYLTANIVIIWTGVTVYETFKHGKAMVVAQQLLYFIQMLFVIFFSKQFTSVLCPTCFYGCRGGRSTVVVILQGKSRVITPRVISISQTGWTGCVEFFSWSAKTADLACNAALPSQMISFAQIFVRVAEYACSTVPTLSDCESQKGLTAVGKLSPPGKLILSVLLKADLQPPHSRSFGVQSSDTRSWFENEFRWEKQRYLVHTFSQWCTPKHFCLL